MTELMQNTAKLNSVFLSLSRSSVGVPAPQDATISDLGFSIRPMRKGEEVEAAAVLARFVQSAISEKKTKQNKTKQNKQTNELTFFMVINRAYEKDPRFYYWTYAVDAELRMKITRQLMDAVVVGALQQKVNKKDVVFVLLLLFFFFSGCLVGDFSGSDCWCDDLHESRRQEASSSFCFDHFWMEVAKTYKAAAAGNEAVQDGDEGG